MSTEDNKPSKVEQHKADGNYLRGTIADTLRDESVASFSEDDRSLLKFHGIYEQDDRDARVERKKQGLDKAYSFMIRIAVPGGRCTAEQYLAVDDLAERYANKTLRLTTRQAFQLHGILKADLWTTMNGISKALLTSLAACGDIPRNVMASPAPYDDDIHRGVQEMARTLAHELRPASGAYHEIWVDGEKILNTDEQKRADAQNEEPFYGATYLPRKFKVGVAIDFDNSIDLYAYDAGLVAITDNGKIVGYNVLAGGGLGMTHGKPDTIARMASVLGCVAPEHGVEAIRNVVAIFRDHGNRSDRRHARLKYLLEEWGVEKFVDEFKSRCAFEVKPPHETQPPRQLDHLGRHEQGDGNQFLGVWIENGRIKDEGAFRLRAAFQTIAKDIAPTFILTPMQSMILADLTPEQADACERVLADHGVPTLDSLSNARRYAMACPALPTCGLAITESERVSPALITELETALEDLGLADVELTVRMTGCPNGCARPYNADIGLVGKKAGKYNVYVGGGLGGDRLADCFAEDVDFEAIRPTLQPLLQRFAQERNTGEGLSDFYRRAVATDRPTRTVLTGREEPTNALYSLTIVN